MIAPDTGGGVQASVILAKAGGLRVRVRGNAHSRNGSCVPLPGELLLGTGGVNHYRFDAEGTVTVGGGATVWHTNAMLARFGFQLPVHNDAGPAFSVGGYICAGGIGALGPERIGFWEAVTEVAIVTGTGVLRRIRRHEDDFRWLFGSAGQFGVIVEATVRILPLGDSAPRYPRGATGRVAGPRWPGPETLWYHAFIPAEAAGQEIESRPPAFHIPLRFRTFTPPLLSPHQGDLIVVGTFGDVPVDADFDYAGHYGKETLREFAARKYRFDPDWLFCAGPLADVLRTTITSDLAFETGFLTQ